MRVALLSNVTVDLLAGMLEKNAEVYLAAGYDTWQQEMMVPGSGLYEYKPEATVVLLHADAYPDAWEDMEKGSQIIDGWIAAVNLFCERLPNVPVLVSSIDISDVRCNFGAEIRWERFFENRLTEEIQKLHETGKNVYVLPVKELVSDIGRVNFYSSKMWYIGSMPYSIKGLSAIDGLISRFLFAIRGTKKKCIAVDLDNTLWGGVIGEDGVGGIVLSDNKEGARYKDAQRLIKKMKDQGVMVAILSKNNAEDVEPVYSHTDMILQHKDFVAELINWESKPSNIRKLAADLNIGLDSFVFLDDNPAEREQMKAECPEVAVIDFPKDSSELPYAIAKAYDDYFFSLEVTEEDTRKTAMYQAETNRKSAFRSAASVEDFLKNLEMTMNIHYLIPEEEKRVVQLINKTNQFNVTTRRYSETEVHTLAESDDSDIITVHMADKYGDQGLVAVVILRYKGKRADIDTFLMSCRVMGRNAENEIMAQIKKLFQEKGIETVRAVYIKSAKNAPVRDLFETLNFTLLSNENDNLKKYEIKVASIPDSMGVFKAVYSGAWI